ncbi:MAG: hypothetical protein Q7T03_02115, partial [Deltaproteobacteria bacterium]|nr:hypothetical protein [Deltaproteobacteria bacterium]
MAIGDISMLFGVGASVYADPLLAAQALVTAEVLGADVLAVRDVFNDESPRGVYSKLFSDSLDAYLEAHQKSDPVGERRAKLTLGFALFHNGSSAVTEKILARVESLQRPVEGEFSATVQPTSIDVENLKRTILENLEDAFLAVRGEGSPLVDHLFTLLP